MEVLELETWTEVTFDDFVTLQRGKDLTRAEFREGNIPVAGSNGIIGYHDEALVKGPGVTVGRSGATGRVTYYNAAFWPHNTSLYVRDFKGNHPRFVAYYLEHLDLGKFSSGVAVPTLDRNSFRTISIEIPPLPEQQRIAQVLSTVQEAIAQQERLIRTTTELKQALMQKLFTEGLRGEALNETEIGRVPESWEVVKLEDLADVRSGKRLPKGNALVAEDTGYPYIRVTDFEDNTVLTEQLLFVPTHIQPRIQRYIIEKDDVYISVAGSIGIVGMIPGELDGANLTENANRLVIRNKKRIEPRYLMYWLDSERCQHEIKAQTLKNAQPKLALGRIKTLAVALPSIEEQKDMVLALDAVRTKRQVAERKTKTLQDLFRTLLHELMTGKVRVGEVL